MMTGFKNLICPLCLNFLYKCTTTVCGHSFCERCLDEYLIIRKVSSIKDNGHRLASCATRLSGTSNSYRASLSTMSSSRSYRGSQLRQARSLSPNLSSKRSGMGRLSCTSDGANPRGRTFKLDRNRIDSIEPGAKIDVRDTEYIWCSGTVKIKIECPNKDPLLVVHYEGWNKYYDEVIKQTSPRLAPHGTYTSRKDLPRYHLKQDNSMVGIIVNRVLAKEPAKPADEKLQASQP